MIKVLRDWMQRYFSDEEAVVLAIMLVLGFSVILAFGGMLAPVLAAMVIAFLIQGVVGMLERFRVPHLFAVWLVYSLFLGWRCSWWSCCRCSGSNCSPCSTNCRGCSANGRACC